MWRRNSHILYGRKKMLEDDNFLLTGFKENEGRIVIFDDAIDSFTNNLCPRVSDMINKNNDYLMNVQTQLIEKMDAIQVQIKEREGRYQEANREDDPELKASEDIYSFYKLYLESINGQIAQEESKIKLLKQQHAFLLAASHNQNAKKIATVVKYFREKLEVYRGDSLERQQQNQVSQSAEKTCILSKDYSQYGEWKEYNKEQGSLTCRQSCKKHESPTKFVKDYGFKVGKSAYSNNWSSPFRKQVQKDLEVEATHKAFGKSKSPPKNEKQSVIELEHEEDHKKQIIILNKMRSTFKKVSRSTHYKSKPPGIQQDTIKQDPSFNSKIEETELMKGRQNTPERQNKSCLLRDLSFTTPQKKTKQEFDSRVADQAFSRRVLSHWENIQKNQAYATSNSFIGFKYLDTGEQEKGLTINQQQQLLPIKMKFYTPLKKQQNIQPQVSSLITNIEKQLETEKERNLLLKKQVKLKTARINKIYSFLSECILIAKKNIGSKLLQSATRKQLSESKFIQLVQEVDKELQNQHLQRNDLEGDQEQKLINPIQNFIKQQDQAKSITGTKDKIQNLDTSKFNKEQQYFNDERIRMRTFSELTVLQILFILLRDSHLATKFLEETALKKNKAEYIFECIKNE